MNIPVPSVSKHASHEVAPGVVCIPLSMVNVYLVRSHLPNGEWVLIDCGLRTSASKIARAVADHCGEGKHPRAIVLTHGHFDHIGTVEKFAADWNVPVYAHALERPYLTGEDQYPPPSPAAGRGMMAWSSPIYSRGPIDITEHLQDLPQNGSVPHLPDWRWIATPGHSPGHVSLFRDSDRVLIAGDAVVTTNQESVYKAIIAKPPELNGPPTYFTPDFGLAKRSVRALAMLNPNVLLTGHGKPMEGATLRRDLRHLADYFDELAAPRHGRYKDYRHAIASRHGVEYVPPLDVNPLLIVAGGLAAGVFAGIMAGRKLSDANRLSHDKQH